MLDSKACNRGINERQCEALSLLCRYVLVFSLRSQHLDDSLANLLCRYVPLRSQQLDSLANHVGYNSANRVE